MDLRISRFATLALLATPLITSAGLAQSVPPSTRMGPFAGFPAGITVTKGSRAANDPDEILFAPPGHVSDPAVQGATGSRPRWTLTDLFGTFTGNMSRFEFTAICSGNAGTPTDWNVDSTGTRATPDLWDEATETGRFFFLVASIANGSAGVPGSLLEGPGKGADLVSYTFSQSAEMPSDLLGQTHLEASGADLGFDPGADIDGFDLALGVLAFNPNLDVFSEVPFAPFGERTFFFSVSRDFAADNIGQAFAVGTMGQTTPTIDADAAAIYRMDWTPDSSLPAGGSWSRPFVYRSRTQLGLSASALESVDAITINANDDIVIFSTEYHGPELPTRNQLLVQTAEMLVNNQALAVADGPGDPVSVRLGVGDDDDLDGACGNDPEVISPSTTYLAGADAGIPRPNFWSTLAPMYPAFATAAGISAARRSKPSGATAMYISITGWGPSTPTDCLVDLFWSTPAPVSTRFKLATLSRSSADDIMLIDWDAPDILGFNWQLDAVGYVIETPENGPPETRFLFATWPVHAIF
ncbi:MAG: hypothetical protein NXI31_20785 [bacterium]|nr:hypothetical protein [bacterium]